MIDATGRLRGVLRQRFGARMARTPSKELLEVVTAPTGALAEDYKAISAKVAEVDQFRAFMEGYC